MSIWESVRFGGSISRSAFSGRGRMAQWVRGAGKEAARAVYAAEARAEQLRSGKPGVDFWPTVDARACRRVAQWATGRSPVDPVDLYTRALADWAEEEYRERARAAGKRPSSAKAEAYGESVSAMAALGRVSPAAWGRFARFYLPQNDQQPGGDIGEREALIEEPQEQPKGRDQQRQRPGTGGEPMFRREANTKSAPDMRELAAALEDALRERVVEDDTGATVRPAAELALWAAEGLGSPLGEPQPGLSSPVELLVLVDASSSTNGGIDKLQGALALALMAAVRGAGHRAACAPWGGPSGDLKMREGIGWEDPLPSGGFFWPGIAGTDIADAHQLAVDAFPDGSKARRIVLLLTDGEVDQMRSGQAFEGTGAVAAIWALGSCSRVPDWWTGPRMETKRLADAAHDLAGSQLLRYLQGLGG